MAGEVISKATLGRLPLYLHYLKSSAPDSPYISAAGIARALGLGEVQVRKDLSAASCGGKPKVGYEKKQLTSDLEGLLGCERNKNAVIVGAGKIGMALLSFEGFSEFGLEITAAFDSDSVKSGQEISGKSVLPIEQLDSFCRAQGVRIGIITVPANQAQKICDLMVSCGITAIWNFAPVTLSVPKGITVSQENLALSLAHLSSLAKI